MGKSRIMKPRTIYVKVLRKEVDLILDILAKVLNNPGIRSALVTDNSRFGDFFWDDSNQNVPRSPDVELLIEVTHQLGIDDIGAETSLIYVASEIYIRGQS
jgi:hypothetical protein